MTKTRSTQKYRLYDLCFESEFILSGIPECEGDPDVVVRWGALEADDWKDVPRGGNTVFAIIDGRIQFLIRDGSSVVLDRLGEIPNDEVRGYLLGLIMATVLRQRGFLVLHACCMERDGLAVAFAGESGWGKSTLAEYFVQQGYHLLNDDVTAIRFDENGNPLVIPGYPEIRLREDAGSSLVDNFEELPQILRHSSKRLRVVDSIPTKPLPLSHLFLLQPRYRDTTEVLSLPQQQAVIELVAHTRVTNLFNDPEFMRHHLEQCSELVRKIPVQRLHRVRSFDTLPDILRVVEKHSQSKKE